MAQPKMGRILSSLMIVALLMASFGVTANAAVESAPAAQTIRAEEVRGVITGGQFAEIWLGLEPTTPNERVTVSSTWDRNDPSSHGVGFYVLTEQNVSAVLNGGKARDNNLSAASSLGPESLANEVGVEFNATGGTYTIVVFNDSNTDAEFTLTAKNAFITDESSQVRDPNASAATPEAEEEAAEEAAPAPEATAEAEATPEPAATPEAEETAAAEATPEAEETETPAPASTPGVARAQELKGELAEQNAQHYFGLEPSERDGTMNLVLAFDPQDSSELARRMNFWVLDEAGFNRFLDPNTNVILSNLAISAGSSHPDLAANERAATFSASGLGPYIVIVYNNSEVPATYTLRVDGGILVDDSGQTLTAQEGVATPVAEAGEAGEEEAAAETAGEEADTTTPAVTREGEPGGTYTVQAGDTLSLIARDIYGSVGVWEALCSFNNLADCNSIEVGDVLQLPTEAQISSGASAPAAAATPAPAATTAPAATSEAEEEAEPSATTPVTTTTGITATETMTETEEAATDEEEEQAAEPAVDLITVLEAQGSFTNLVDALTAAGLADALKGPGPFTIFAPTDAAFAALPAGALDQLMSNPTQQLTQILLFHVLPGAVLSADVTDGMQATTQQGKPVSFEVAADAVKVNGANVVVPDLEATNGVVHAIDAVILPPPD
ncbi:MAG: fasciclin domain-containing protein [Chloroflexota bacterium]|nr:fasciclin domain-containing protein [Chloroflexota bacterium]